MAVRLYDCEGWYVGDVELPAPATEWPELLIWRGRYFLLHPVLPDSYREASSRVVADGPLASAGAPG